MRIKHIDGIRGISVIAVVLFHALPQLFPNGYLGVDYFLVISGFVISKKYFLYPDIEFSFFGFLKKRIKRLYPQLLVCILISLPVAYFSMQPDYLENFSQSVISTLLGVNNFLLSFTGGYWAVANKMKPLFNTWSLSLEMQFYLIAAIIISITKNRAKYIKPLFIILILSSLFISSIGIFYFPRSNYLLLPSRIWEFLFGVVGAYIASRIEKNKISYLPIWLSNISFISIFIFLLFPIETIRYSPNPFMIFPLIFITFLCIENRSTLSVKILSLPLLTYIGLSSYAIYLYHQPILAFTRLTQFYELNLQILILLIAISMLFGIFMYELIENRKILDYFSNSFLNFIYSFPLIILSSFVIMLVNIPSILFQGLVEIRFPDLLIDGKVPEGLLGGKGYTDSPFKFLNRSFRELDSINDRYLKKFNIFVYGNSQARDFVNTLLEFEHLGGFDFNISYSDDLEYTILNERKNQILNDADIIFIQTFDGVNLSKNNIKIPNELIIYKEKTIALKGREIFLQNINPVLFLEKSKRKNLLVKNMDINKCLPKDLFVVNSKAEEKFFAVIDTECAFNKNLSEKLLTSNKGEILTFDGVHLSKAGANYLAKNLTKYNEFMELFRKSAKDKIK